MMGLFDSFRKKEKVDGTYHRDRNIEEETLYRDDGTFRMTVQDVFVITGRGCVVTGRVEKGSVALGDSVTLRRTDGSTRMVTVTGIEMFRKVLKVASQGDNVGLFLSGVEKRNVARGDILERTWQ